MLVTLLWAALTWSPSAGSAEIVCDGLPAAARQQCESLDRLLKEGLEDLATRGQQIEAAQRKLDTDSASILDKCKERRAGPTCPDPPRNGERTSTPGASTQMPQPVRDCPTCPPLAPVAKGAGIVLGAEHGRQAGATALDPGTPLPAKSFLMQVHEVSVGEFEAYLDGTGKRASFERTCLVQPGSGSMPEEVIIKEPSVFHALSLPPPPDLAAHPAVCVTREDAVAYAAWLSQKAGGRVTYRLPTEIEWEYAARPHSGNAPLPPLQEYALCGMMNIADSQFNAAIPTIPLLRRIGIANRHSDLANCNDSSALTEPVTRRSPTNPYGLVNMLGNVSELTSSCWSSGSGAGGADCSRYVVRGGSFASPAGLVTLWARQSINSTHAGKAVGYFDVGFRLMREVAE